MNRRALLTALWLTGLSSAQVTLPQPPARPLLQVSPPAAPATDKAMFASSSDIDHAAERLATLLDGVLRNCPSDFAAIGTPDKRCVGVSGSVEDLRQRLNTAYSGQWYGAWRSRDDQRTVYNWLMTPSGPIYLRLEPADAGHTLLYLDVPDGPSTPASASTPSPNTASPTSATITTVINGVTIRKPAPSVTVTAPPVMAPTQAPNHQTNSSQANSNQPTNGHATAPSAATVSTTPPAPNAATNSAANTTLALMAFTRTLQLQQSRLHGPDVLSVQNRLIALTVGSGPSKGDGWYGPNTARTVADFQRANGLPVTGKVDKATWDKLFSPSARRFKGQ